MCIPNGDETQDTFSVYPQSTRPRSTSSVSLRNYEERTRQRGRTFGARKNCRVPCSKSNWTSRGTSFDMCSETSRAKGADLAKFDRYLRENVSVTCFSRMMETPGSESSLVFAFLLAWSSQLESKRVGRDGVEGRRVSQLTLEDPLADFRFLGASSSSCSSSADPSVGCETGWDITHHPPRRRRASCPPLRLPPRRHPAHAWPPSSYCSRPPCRSPRSASGGHYRYPLLPRTRT